MLPITRRNIIIPSSIEDGAFLICYESDRNKFSTTPLWHFSNAIKSMQRYKNYLTFTFLMYTLMYTSMYSSNKRIL